MKTLSDVFRRFKGYVGSSRWNKDIREQCHVYQKPIGRVFNRREVVKSIGGLIISVPIYSVLYEVTYAQQSRLRLRGRAVTEVAGGEETIVGTFGDGTINFSTLNMTSIGSGAINNQKVWVSENPLGCIIRGGSANDIPQNYVTLRGFQVDSSLDPSYPDTARGLDAISGIGIRFEQMHFKGVTNRYLGYAWDADLDGSYTTGDEGGGHAGGAVRSQAGSEFTLYQCLVNGYEESFGSVLASMTLDQCILRNCFSGPAFGTEASGVGTLLHIKDSAIFQVMNHLNSLKCLDTGTMIWENTVVAITQNIWGATGPSWKGADILRVLGCTFYAPPEQAGWTATGYMAGGSSDNIRDEITVRNNIFNLRNSAAITILTSQLGILDEHHNLVCQRVLPDTNKFMRLDGSDLALSAWQTATGDGVGSIHNSQPVYVNAPVFAGAGPPNPGNVGNLWGWDRAVPNTGDIVADLATMRGWFTLSTGSPGKNAASDGGDMGIRPIV